jgi:VanZ family protein
LKSTVFFIAISYVILLLIIAVLPINPEHSTANTTYIFGIRLDYIFHGLFFVPWMSFSYLFGQSSTRKLWYWFFGGLLLAACTEGVQYFTPYRSLNLKDLTANTCGLILGCLCLFFLKPGKRRI